uniref:RRM domain-containing protein n=1 Tax=Physcomitrium patens TaxID=3218 RepID=A0A2K1IVL6_PHYPA|nr:hypothetical protein PHYPA_025265 [Physcomitrium patens]
MKSLEVLQVNLATIFVSALEPLGYALIEYKIRKEAQGAIANMNEKQLLTQTISVNWAFSSGPLHCRNV